MGKGRGHKLLAAFDGQSLIRRSVSAALASDCQKVVVVTGYRSKDISAQIVDLSCEVAHNADYQSGMAGSLRTGVEAASKDGADAIMILLADMPRLSTEHLVVLIAAFRSSGGKAMVRAVGGGSPGNPVIFPNRCFDDLRKLRGDVGARSLIGTGLVPVVDVEIGDAALVDVDTVEQVLSEGGIVVDLRARIAVDPRR